MPNAGAFQQRDCHRSRSDRTGCTAEPSGIYFDLGSTTLFVNVLHRTGPDLGVMIKRDPKP